MQRLQMVGGHFVVMNGATFTTREPQSRTIARANQRRSSPDNLQTGDKKECNTYIGER
jgi:hypothetical protein